jgi:pilus assembly protein CpaD
MRRHFALLALATALAGCTHDTPTTSPARGLAPVNVPVVSRAEYVFDAAAPDGSLPSSEEARLNAWFSSLNLGYGDAIYVDGAAPSARGDVARVAGQYGMLISEGSPVTAGMVAPGSVRVVVSRARASVPNCPNWSRPSQPNFDNSQMSNLGCGVNSNLAAMIANPDDLVHGREGNPYVDAAAASRGVGVYYTTPPTGKKGLQSIDTKGK